MNSRLNLFLLAAFLASVGLNWALRENVARPNLEYLPEMVHSVAYDAFAPNPNFADGKTLQRPVPGTIPRGYARAGDSILPERGALIFQTFCVPCHGAGAKGDGPVALRGYPPPPSLLAEKALNLEDSKMFQILTNGQNNMPSYASQISREDRWRVILYVRSLQRKPGGQP